MPEMTIAPVATHGFFVDGRWSEDGDLVEIHAPYDGSLIARVVQGRREHAEAAIAAAVKAFGTTRRLPAFERQRVLRRISASMTERKEEFARTLAQEAGKPIKAARIEVERSIFTFNVAAEESTRIYGEFLPLDWQEFTAGRWGIVRRFPLGPIAGITPFNFPINLVAHKVAPAIAAGCPMVLKPAPQTPLCSLLLAECVQQAGWPDGGLNVLPLSNEDAGLARDRRAHQAHQLHWQRARWVGTSSAAPGRRRLCSNWAETPQSLCTATPTWLTPPSAASPAVSPTPDRLAFPCSAFWCEQSVYGKFTDLLVEGVKKLKTGDPLDESTDVGPLIRESDAIRTTAWIEEAVHAGARLALRWRAQESCRRTDCAHWHQA